MFEEVRMERMGTVKKTKPQRYLYFRGTKNFRDLGGYQTADGKSLRWGLLYRSDGLDRLTDRDLPRLSALCLDRVIDFRSEFEKGLGADCLPVDGNTKQVAIPILDASTAAVAESRDEFVKKLKDIDAPKFMLETYMGFATQFTPAYQQFFRELIAAEGRPVLFHCTAGKDRTGFAAALILRVLGVPHETVMEDYLLTNEYFYGGYKWNLILARLMKGKRFANAVRGFMRAEPRYLATAFETIDREYGSFDNYIRDGIGLTAADVERFKAIYLE